MTTFPATGPIRTDIQLVSGDITLTASDRTDVVVSVQPRDEGRPADIAAAGSAVVEFLNSVLTVKTAKSWQRMTGPNKRDGAVTVTIDLPSGSTLAASTGIGFIHAEGELATTVAKSGIGDIRLDQVGNLSAKTGFGDILVDGITRDATVATATGAIRLGSVDGNAKAKNANGVFEIAECAQNLHLRTASGNINVGRAHASVNAGSAAGNVQITQVESGSVTVKTGAGAIDIGIREGAAAWLEVASKHGSVRNGLTRTDSPAQASSQVEVRARTGVGDITIMRASAA